MAEHRCPCCEIKIYFSDERWGWLRGLSSLLLAILMTSFWFPRRVDLGYFLLWLGSLLIVFVALLIGSMFILPPNISLVPSQGPIQLDI